MSSEKVSAHVQMAKGASMESHYYSLTVNIRKRDAILESASEIDMNKFPGGD